MTDFYSVLRRAVGNLESNTPEARKQLYARAETALVAQLQKNDPPPGETQIAQMRENLRKASGQIESEEGSGQAAAPTGNQPPAVQPTPSGYVSPLRQRLADRQAGGGSAASPTQAATPQNEPPVQQPEPAAPPPPPPPPQPQPEPPQAQPAPAMPQQPAPQQQYVPPVQPAPVVEAQPAPDYGDAYSSPPPPPAHEGAEQRMPPSFFDEDDDGWPETGAFEPKAKKRPWGWLITLLVLGAIAGAGYWKRDAIMQAAQPLIELVQSENGEEPKVDVRISEPAPEEQPAEPAPDVRQAGEPNAATEPVPGAVEALLVEEGDNPQAPPNETPGTVNWTLQRENGLPVIEGVAQIPSRNISLTLVIHKNTDPAFPATHTIDFIFNVPADLGGGGINNVPGLLVKATPKARGGPLAGEVVRVDEGIFLMALLAGELDAAQNNAALSSQPFLDVPVIYANGQRAIITLAKGPEGTAVFAQAFAEWGLGQ